VSVDGSKQRQVARVAADTVERRQVVGLPLDVHHHLDGLLEAPGVLASLGRVAQQVLEYRDVVVDARARSTQVLGQRQLTFAAVTDRLVEVLSDHAQSRHR